MIALILYLQVGKKQFLSWKRMEKMLPHAYLPSSGTLELCRGEFLMR